jgi:hypothetical protein
MTIPRKVSFTPKVFFPAGHEKTVWAAFDTPSLPERSGRLSVHRETAQRTFRDNFFFRRRE